MAGPNMELFRFGLYVFFPIGIMYYFGDTEFFEKYVKHIKFWPDKSVTNHPPTNRTELIEELSRLRTERLARKFEKEAQMQQQTSNVQHQPKQ